MTRAQQDRLYELLKQIERRHGYGLGHERLLREAVTYQDVREALALLKAEA